MLKKTFDPDGPLVCQPTSAGAITVVTTQHFRAAIAPPLSAFDETRLM